MARRLPPKGRISLPARRLSVRKIKEVLRLKFSVGLGLRQIARSCSIGLGTVHEYLQRAEAAGVTWPLGWREPLSASFGHFVRAGARPPLTERPRQFVASKLGSTSGFRTLNLSV